MNMNNNPVNNQMNMNNNPMNMNLNPMLNCFYNMNFNPINNINFQQMHLIANETDKINIEEAKICNKQIFLNNNDPKKILKYLDLNEREYEIYVPIYLNKSELYKVSKTIFGNNLNYLIYKDNILSDDYTSIEDIEENSRIIILFKDESFVDYLNKNYKFCNKINISISLMDGSKMLLFLPNEITVSQMLQAIISRLNIDISKFKREFHRIFYSDNYLDLNNYQKLKDYFLNRTIISLKLTNGKNLVGGPGIFILMEIYVFDKKTNIFKQFSKNKYSALNSLFKTIEYEFNLQLKKIFYKQKELDKNDIKSLASVCLNDRIFCYIESNNLHILNI